MFIPIAVADDEQEVVLQYRIDEGAIVVAKRFGVVGKLCDLGETGNDRRRRYDLPANIAVGGEDFEGLGRLCGLAEFR